MCEQKTVDVVSLKILHLPRFVRPWGIDLFPSYNDFSARNRSAANSGYENLGPAIFMEPSLKIVSSAFFYADFEFELHLEKLLELIPGYSFHRS